MKVYHLTNDIAEASGAGMFVRRISEELVRLGVESRYFTEVPADAEAPDIVHIHGMWCGVHRAAIRWARKNGCKVVWSTHGMTAPWAIHHKWWKKAPVWYLYQWRDLRSADLIHCTTELEVDWNRAYGLGGTFVVPLGTALPREVKVRGEGEEVEKVGGQRTVKTLLFVGRVYPVKALDRIIQAFQLVPHAGWRLRIVGPDQAGHLAELKKIAGPEVDFAGPKFGDELAAEYANCDCAILASHTENFGATIVDGMAHGKPVIAGTKTPWEIVAERGCGWWVDNEPEVLSKAMAEMMALSDEERAAMGQRGRRLVEERYTWPSVGRAMISAYEGLLKEEEKTTKVDLSKYQNRHSLSGRLVRLVWQVTWFCCARLTPRWCFNRWRCFVLRCFGAKIGKGCRIYGSAEVWQPWNLTLGDNCWVDVGVKLYTVDKIMAGDNCVISSGAFICTAQHDISSPIFELATAPIKIGNSAWITSNAIVLPGIKVGEGAVVAAGSVVVKDVEPWTVVGGNPAKFIKKRELKG